MTARRAILRKPIDRIGYGGYLKLATQFPDFIDYVESVCKEFRELYENIKGTTPYCVKRVAILNCWGKMRAWGNHMVHHAIYYKQNYSYAGIIEALSGAPFDVKFISFDDIRNHPDLLDSFDVVLNVGDAYTAYTGGDNWKDEAILTAVRRFVYRGGGFIGVGEPASCQWQGHFFQLADILGVEEETGYTLNVDKYNWQDHAHFITEDSGDAIDFGEGKKNIFALESATVLRQIDKGVQLAVNTFGQGRGVYISGLPYSFANSRLLYRAILWAASAEGKIHRWFSTNYNVEVHAYVKTANTVSSTTRMNRSRRPFTGGTAAVLRSTLRPMRSSGTRSRKETVCGRHRGRAWFPDGMPAKIRLGRKADRLGNFCDRKVGVF